MRQVPFLIVAAVSLAKGRPMRQVPFKKEGKVYRTITGGELPRGELTFLPLNYLLIRFT